MVGGHYLSKFYHMVSRHYLSTVYHTVGRHHLYIICMIFILFLCYLYHMVSGYYLSTFYHMVGGHHLSSAGQNILSYDIVFHTVSISKDRLLSKVSTTEL